MILAVQTIEKKITNKNISWIEPNGGYTIWLALDNTNLSYEELNDTLYSNQVRVALGKDFFPSEEKRKYFRLSIASLNEKEIILGIERLANAIKQIYKN